MIIILVVSGAPANAPNTNTTNHDTISQTANTPIVLWLIVKP